MLRCQTLSFVEDAHCLNAPVFQDVMENLVPTILEAHVKGNPRVLKRWTGEALYNKLNAEITQRKSEGIQLDEHILAIEEANVINVAYEEGAGQSPIIVLQFMVQQIHCIRKNGEIVEVRIVCAVRVVLPVGELVGRGTRQRLQKFVPIAELASIACLRDDCLFVRV